MDKQDLVNKIICILEEEIRVIEQSAQDAKEEAKGNDSLAESQSDSRALEASRLAEVQLIRAKEARRKLELFRKLELRQFAKDDVIGTTALVELLHDREHLFFFIGPHGAGVKVEFEDKVIEVISPKSPLGDALIEQSVGDSIVVETPKREIEYQIISII